MRIGLDLHRRIVLTASGKGLSLNRFIAELLEKETNKNEISFSPLTQTLPRGEESFCMHESTDVFCA
ncbi:MAG: toxin-antitoxin system HicB family antitoxin [Nitrospirae bacterium]|nr:toxin-antitoxin system HicB family antitoxin [Nitrospirota bacterium]